MKIKNNDYKISNKFKYLLFFIFLIILFTNLYSYNDFLFRSYGNEKSQIESPIQKISTIEIDSVYNNIKWHYLGKPWGATISEIIRGHNNIIITKTKNDGWYKSTDEGNSWQKIISTISNLQIANNEKYLQITGDSLLVSENLEDWYYLSYIPFPKLVVTTDDVYYSINKDSLYISKDNGNSWNYHERPKTESKYYNPICLSSDSILYLGTYFEGKSSLYALKNDTNNWELIADFDLHTYSEIKSLEMMSNDNLLIDIDCCAIYNYNISNNTLDYIEPSNVDDLNGRSYFCGRTDDGTLWGAMENESFSNKMYIVKSINHGITWKKINIEVRSDFNPFFINNNSYLAFRNSTIQKSLDGGNSWQYSDKGLDYNIPVSININKNNALFVGTVLDWFEGGLYRYNNNLEWNRENGQTIDHRIWNIYTKDNYVFTHSIDKIMKYNKSWNRFSTVGMGFLYSSFLGSSDILFVGASDHGIYRSSIYDSNWTSVKNEMPYDYIFFIGENHAGDIITKTWRGGQYYISHNNGNNWEEIDIYMSTPNEFALAGGDTIYSATDNGLYLSSDDGYSWDRILNGQVLRVLYHDKRNILFASIYEFGILFTNDGGKNWNKIKKNEYFEKTRDFAFDKNYNLYICTEKGGIYKTGYFKNIADTTINDTIDVIPKNIIHLYDPYPNPCNTNLNIHWKQDMRLKTSFDIINIKGQVVYSIKPKIFLQGEHNFTLTLKKLSSGVYFIKINTIYEYDIKRFVFLK